MTSFTPPPPKKAEEFRVGEVRFLGEQDGPPERLLKEKLSGFFRSNDRVFRAYLARIDFGEGTNPGVALAIRAQQGAEESAVEGIGTIFASIFNAQEHMDIMFLTDDQETRLSKVCNPFYEQNGVQPLA